MYSISTSKFDTLLNITQALLKEYEIENGVEFVAGEEGRAGPEIDWNRALTGWSQWVGSEKLRRKIGWRDKKIFFSEGIHQYMYLKEVTS
jgi:hypothetical protein